MNINIENQLKNKTVIKTVSSLYTKRILGNTSKTEKSYQMITQTIVLKVPGTIKVRLNIKKTK